tara:strand:+ start:184 stop:534 length:351 start_codon:yes stop_codon:yes gene_type:complete
MSSIAKVDFSESTDGMGVLVVATATTGTSIHTAGSGTTNWDEVWVYANNSHSADVLLTIEYGGVAAKDLVQFTVPLKSGLNLIIPGLILQNAKVITAFASVANVIGLTGFVNRITV